MSLADVNATEIIELRFQSQFILSWSWGFLTIVYKYIHTYTPTAYPVYVCMHACICISIYLSIHTLLVQIVLIYLLELPLTRAIGGSDRHYSSGENRMALDEESTQVAGRGRENEKSLRFISTMRRQKEPRLQFRAPCIFQSILKGTLSQSEKLIRYLTEVVRISRLRKISY